jgi:hypothetical protein
MHWISRDPPIYVWAGDTWFNEKDRCIYTADLTRQIWIREDEEVDCQVIPFTKKTKVMGNGNR